MPRPAPSKNSGKSNTEQEQAKLHKKQYSQHNPKSKEMLTLQNNCKLRKEKQIPGNSFSNFYNGSFKLFQVIKSRWKKLLGR